MTHRLLPCGDRAVLVEVDGIDAAVAAAAAVGALDGIVDVVPADGTVLVRFAGGADLAAEVPRIDALLVRVLREATAYGEAASRELVVPVVYDGPDLGAVAAASGLTVDEVVAAHTAIPWRAAFVGFAPGFVYLVGGDPRLVAARRAEPRSSVPPGSVALAGPYCGIYPSASPGGWQLIGRTDLVLWDAAAEPPATIEPGMSVRFADTGARA